MESVLERYALALFSLAEEQNKVKEYQKEAKEVYASLYNNEEMVHLMSSYFLSEKEKDKVIDETFKFVTLPDLLNFLKVVSSKGRGYLILPILRSFNKKCNESLGIEEGIVYSAMKLEASQIKDVEKAVSSELGLDVILKNELDPSLIGGVKVVVGGKVFDGSLKSTLISMRKSLIQGGK